MSRWELKEGISDRTKNNVSRTERGRNLRRGEETKSQGKNWQSGAGREREKSGGRGDLPRLREMG